MAPSFDSSHGFPMTNKNFQHHLAQRIIALTILVLIATALSALATMHWLAELFSHFTPYCAVFALFCVLGLALLRSWRWAAMAIALVLWNGTPLALYAVHAPPPISGDMAPRSSEMPARERFSPSQGE